MAVAVKPDLMSSVTNSRTVLGERLKGVTGDKPSRLDIVFVEQLENASRSMGTCPDTFTTLLVDACYVPRPEI